MSVRDRMRVSPSRAEITLRSAMEREGLWEGFFADMEICLWKTVPDAYDPTRGITLYLDGPPHLREKVKTVDERITEALEKRGVRVYRFPFKPSGRLGISQKRLKEILQEIREAL